MTQPQAAVPEIKVKVEAGDFEEHIFETKGNVETHMRYADTKHIKEIREQNKERLVESCTAVIESLGEDLNRYENCFGVFTIL
jgi:IMP dehydrogenase/GMP reductase